ncbi:SubName: Full=Uncharacterized protein {ECO:0000313/EMBL:CCA69002.1} [Serendipita indica DSM 11827]|uniref:Uncharacterized protein n=1 Tax=Serendipita indica (strain DSM 11827) TaxID=1109443 RepID=G4TCE8_SERID|nr:SubName: Full=Uncharacterized protein {ECO:0000313/EMBL:CCA69002.1} [Serendipita indica DSM 11827]CCA69002.1 hypothetical protein PIIN_02862 [Serendipita indica DSM 11827]
MRGGRSEIIVAGVIGILSAVYIMQPITDRLQAEAEKKKAQGNVQQTSTTSKDVTPTSSSK